MTDSRKSFEAWRESNVKYIEPADFWPWLEEAFCAAERETARRCYDIIAGQGSIGGQREAYAEAIMAAFPEAFK